MRTPRGSGWSGRAVLATGLVALFALSSGGCAYSMVADGRIRADDLEQIATRVEAVRGVRAERPIDARVVDAGGLVAVLRSAIEAEWQAEDLQAYADGLVTLGLWPRDRDLVAEHVAVMGEEIAGMYVPTQRALYVVSDVETPALVSLASALTGRDLLREFTLAHEIVHLLQHQGYPELIDPDLRSQDDAARALTAALEGDALGYGLLALGAPLQDPESLAASAEEAATSAALADSPALIRLTLLFPYTYGYELFVDEGERLLESPPASTEQVMHPARRRESFAVFDLAALRRRLSRRCGSLSENTVGELQLSILFRDLEPRTHPAAWEGWDGDRYLTARCGERRDLFWLTAWDTGRDAAEFEDAYRRVAPEVAARAGLAAPPEVLRSGRRVLVVSPGLAAWADEPRSLEEIVRSDRVADVFGLRAHFATPGAPGSPAP